MSKGKVHRDEWPEIARRRFAGESFAGIGRDYGCSAPAMRYIVNQFERLPPSIVRQLELAAPKTQLNQRGFSRSTFESAKRRPPTPRPLALTSDDYLAAARYAASDIARFLGAIDAALFDPSQKSLVDLLTATEHLMFLAARVHQGVKSLLEQRS